MANRYITIVRKGVLISRQVRPRPLGKPVTLNMWKAACATAAVSWGARRYAFRYGGQVHVLDVGSPEPLRSFPNADAAAMWLLIKHGGDNG